MTPEAVWHLMGVALTAYVVTGGADFGGGVWDLLARGPRKDAQRDALAHAIAPIWEANHIWLIFLVVLQFTVFPKAFHATSVALHVPLTAALVGIVLRGAAFAFRSYGFDTITWRRTWGRVFAVASLLTPICLGLSLAALATGDIRWDGVRVTSGFFVGWTTPFALLTGLMTAALAATLAAVYMTAETEGDLRADFRRRALGAQAVTVLLGGAVLAAAHRDAPDFAAAFGWQPLLPGTVALGVTVGALLTDRPRLARFGVAVQGVGVVAGWGLGMQGHLVRPDLTLQVAGARPAVLEPLLPALLIGGAVLAPSLWYLYRVFKGRGAVAE
ncbi:MAG: cytochrome d ubiquinol oxidase subunit II [Myxococcales bacterium]|nr:cytochrome d ubiquinol oxidase subunit II [Myxococcales bacterium]